MCERSWADSSVGVRYILERIVSPRGDRTKKEVIIFFLLDATDDALKKESFVKK